MSVLPTEQSAQKPDIHKLSVGTKLAYGFGDFGVAMVSMVKGFFLLNFLINIAGLQPGKAGLILLIAKIWDAVNDPLIGSLSDRTRTRWGRRRPWILIGAIPFAIAYFLQFYVPDMGETAKFIYYIIIAIFLDLGFSAVNVPYAALTPELSEDEKERTSLNMYRFSFSVIGGLLAAIIYNVLVNQVFADNQIQGNIVQGIVIGIIILISHFVVVAFTRERDSRNLNVTEENQLSILEGIKVALQSKPFIHVLLIYMFSWLAVQFVQSLLLFYYRDYVGGNPANFTFVLMGLQLSIFAFILFWGWMARKIGRKNVYYIGVPFWIVVQVCLFFVQPGQITLMMILGILAGVGVSLAFLIPWSLLPDVVDDDELKTGQRREGIFYGFFVFLQKFGIAIGLFVQGLVLQWSGYITVTDGTLPVQPDSALMAIRILTSLVPIIFLILSLIVVYRNPIDAKKLKEIQAQLAIKRQQKPIV